MAPRAAAAGRSIPTDVKDERLVKERRRQIVDAAVGLFIDNGFHKTTTRQLAKASGLAIGTLYEYVKSKEDVLYLVCEAIHQEMEKRLTERIGQSRSGAQGLAAAIEVYFTVCHEMSDHILLIYQETKSLPPESMRFVLDYDERIAHIFRDLIEQGCNDFTLKPMNGDEQKLMATNIVVLGHMWTFRRWSLNKNFNLDQYIEHQRDLILGSLI